MFPQRALKISAKTLNESLQAIKHWYRVSGTERMSSWQPVLLDSPTAAFGTVRRLFAPRGFMFGCLVVCNMRGHKCVD